MIPSHISASLLILISSLFDRGFRGAAPAPGPLRCDCRCEVKIEQPEPAVAVLVEEKARGASFLRDLLGVALGASLGCLGLLLVRNGRPSQADQVLERFGGSGLSPRSSLSASSEGPGEIRQQT